MTKVTYTKNNLKGRIDKLQDQINSSLETKITQRELMKKIGKYCDVTDNAIMAYCMGTNDPRLITALKLAEYFNCKIEDIFQIKDF